MFLVALFDNLTQNGVRFQNNNYFLQCCKWRSVVRSCTTLIGPQALLGFSSGSDCNHYTTQLFNWKVLLGLCNVDEVNPNKPGTAIIWLNELTVDITNIVICRVQLLKIWDLQFLNVYGYPGTQGQKARKILFRDEILPYISSNRSCLPLLIGDFNCVLRPQDVSKKNFWWPWLW